jgi:hypothetical protein
VDIRGVLDEYVEHLLDEPEAMTTPGRIVPAVAL